MLDYIKRFWAEAKGKLSTYLGLLIIGASELREDWSNVTDFLGDSPKLQFIARHVYLVLGLLVIWARVRSLLKDSDGSSTGRDRY